MIGKKGSEKLLSIWWLLVLAFVGVGITAGVFIFYSENYDVRFKEANLLHNRFSDCLIDDDGFLIEGFFEESFNIFSSCNIEEGLFGEGSNYYFEVIMKVEDENLKAILEGRHSFSEDCGVQEGVQAERFPKCVDSEKVIFYLEENKIKEAKLRILTASNQMGELAIR